MSPLNQLREDRRHALNGWLGGSTPDGSPRWPGDDGRILMMAEMQFWPQSIKDAEAAKFAALDQVYEAAKAKLKV